MMIGIFISVAVVLVVFGGLLAAADAALSVLSRTDLTDLSSQSRSRKSLLAIAQDPGAHINALSFMRVVAETTAAATGASCQAASTRALARGSTGWSRSRVNPSIRPAGRTNPSASKASASR